MTNSTSVIAEKYDRKYLFIMSFALLSALAAMPLLAQEKAATSMDDAVVTVPLRAEGEPTRKLGEATTNLLSLQVSGAASGLPLPMLGVTSNLSWQRYLDSFKYKIPESFENKVQATSN